MMTTLMQASNQWATRPDDERFTSLIDMRSTMHRLRDNSVFGVASTRKIEVFAVDSDPTHRALRIGVDEPGPLKALDMEPTNWSFGQLCSLASPGNSRAGYFRDSKLPAPIIAAALNFNLRFTRDVESVGLLGTQSGGTKGAGPPPGRNMAGSGTGRS
jgi:hypothetical protein